MENRPSVVTQRAQRASRWDSMRLSSIRTSVTLQVEQLRRRLHLSRLLMSVVRCLVISVILLFLLMLLTVLVAVLFYSMNRNGNTGSDKYRKLKALQAQYNDTLYEVLRLSKSARVFEDGNLTMQLIRLKQLGQNVVQKDVYNGIKQLELKPDMDIAMYYAVTLVSLIGYGEFVGASELQYFCSSLCMLIVVPIWHIYHYQLYHLFYFLQLYCHRRWFRPVSQSNRTMMVLWAIRIRNASVYRRSRFYLSNLVLMLIMFPLCLAVFAFTNRELTFPEQLWLTVQSIFHIGLGDLPDKSVAYWPVTFFMISTCFLIYFQCFSFIMPQYPALRLSRISQSN